MLIKVDRELAMLTADQRKLVKVWVAAGLCDKEIIRNAEAADPPFKISRQAIHKCYRTKTAKKIKQLVEETGEFEALSSGLAVKEKRIVELERLYQMSLMRVDKNGNRGDIQQGRGCLDDIAKELGERRQKVDMTGNIRVRDIVAIKNRVYGEDA